MSSVDTMRDHFRGAMLGAALGDALGASFEGRPAQFALTFDDLDVATEVLRYTDDTHMMIGLAQSLIDCDGFDGSHLMQTFARNYAEEPWRGYGAGPPKVFELVAGGVPWNEAAAMLYGGAGSFGNGAAMRVAPVALFAQRDLQQVARLASESARITHTHPLAVDGAVAQACCVAVVLSLHELETASAPRLRSAFSEYLETTEFRRALEEIDFLSPGPPPAQVVRYLGNDITALRSVPTAIASFLHATESFEEVVRFAISLGGDTDTIACMAGALAGAKVGESGLPTRWLAELENASKLRRLADQLYDHRR